MSDRYALEGRRDRGREHFVAVPEEYDDVGADAFECFGVPDDAEPERLADTGRGIARHDDRYLLTDREAIRGDGVDGRALLRD